jgi:hypothetical protein
VIAGHAGISVAAVRQALSAHEKADPAPPAEAPGAGQRPEEPGWGVKVQSPTGPVRASCRPACRAHQHPPHAAAVPHGALRPRPAEQRARGRSHLTCRRVRRAQHLTFLAPLPGGNAQRTCRFERRRIGDAAAREHLAAALRIPGR